MARETRDVAALLMITIVGLFIFGSLAALIIAAFQGAQGGEEVWAGLFSLCTACLGAVGGFMTGQAVTQRKAPTGEAPYEDEEKSP